MNKKILVTGNNGFIGPLLVKLLLRKGYDVVGLDIDYFDDSCDFFSSRELKSRITQITKDIRSVELNDLKGIYAICHLAALSNDPMGELNEELTYDINHIASLNLAKLAKEANVSKFLYSSSCSSYGVADDKAVDENNMVNPVTAYAKSKVISEQDISELADENFCVCFLRNATAYGVSPKLRVDLVVNNLTGWAVTENKIKIMSDGSPWRPLIHAEDIGRAFIAMIEAPCSIINKQAYNIGSNSENYRIKDIAIIIKELLPQCEIVFSGEHGNDSRTYRVDFSKIEKDLPNFKPQWTLREGIRELIIAYKDYALTIEDFNSRKYIRLKQLNHLKETFQIDSKLFKLNRL